MVQMIFVFRIRQPPRSYIPYHHTTNPAFFKGKPTTHSKFRKSAQPHIDISPLFLYNCLESQNKSLFGEPDDSG